MRINRMMNRFLPAIVACIALLYTGCTNTHYSMNDPVFRGEIEKRVGLVFPASSQWLGVRFEGGWLDDFFSTAFQAPTSEIDAVFSMLSVTWSTSQRYVHNSKYMPTWFDPDSAVKYRSAETLHPDPHSVLKVLIDDSNADVTGVSTVYLVWHEA